MADVRWKRHSPSKAAKAAHAVEQRRGSRSFAMATANAAWRAKIARVLYRRVVDAHATTLLRTETAMLASSAARQTQLGPAIVPATTSAAASQDSSKGAKEWPHADRRVREQSLSATVPRRAVSFAAQRTQACQRHVTE